MSSCKDDSFVVSVVSAGRFSAFDLARELDRMGCLGRLYTTFPAFKVRPHYPGPRLSTFPWLQAPYWMAGRLHWEKLEARLNWVLSETFDRWAAGTLTDCSVVHALSSWCLHVGRAGRRTYGALVAYDRGSAHIRYEERMLNEEADRLGVRRKAADIRFLEKDEAECHLADVLIVPSTFAKRTFIESGVEASKIRVVPLTANLEIFKPAVKLDPTFRIIFAGRPGLGKGLIYLLKAVEKLKPLKIETVIYGDPTGVDPDLYRADTRHVSWRGTVSQTELAAAMAGASVLVLPSLSDGFGMVVAQAMACGLPVIVSENTGAADLVGDGCTGFVVPIRDSEAIQKRLHYLYSQPEARVEMGRAAFHSAQSWGGWSSYARKVVSVHREALVRAHEGESVETPMVAGRGGA